MVVASQSPYSHHHGTRIGEKNFFSMDKKVTSLKSYRTFITMTFVKMTFLIVMISSYENIIRSNIPFTESSMLSHPSINSTLPRLFKSALVVRFQYSNIQIRVNLRYTYFT